jgi:hypothetical protein
MERPALTPQGCSATLIVLHDLKEVRDGEMTQQEYLQQTRKL